MSKVRIGKKDAVSRIASRLEEEQRAWRQRPLKKDYSLPLYLDATSTSQGLRWGASVTNLALLGAARVNEDSFREVLAIEVAGEEKSVAYASVLGGLSWGPGPLQRAACSRR